MIHLDTHVVVWLYAGLHDRIPSSLRSRLEVEPLGVSPIVRMELAFLNEIGRVVDDPAQVLAELHRSIGLVVDRTAFEEVAAVSSTPRMSFTRDPFDRVIAAQALAAHALLATKDETLRKNLDLAVWD